MFRKMATLLVVFILLAGGWLIFRQVAADGASSQAIAKPVATATASRSADPVATPHAVSPSLVQVELSEEQVNQMLREGLSKQGYNVNDLSVRLEEGRFTATTTQQVAMFSVPVQIVGEASMANGVLEVHIDSADAGGAAVPQSVLDQMTQAIHSEFARGMDSLPIRPVNMQIKPGKLVVQGTPK